MKFSVGDKLKVKLAPGYSDVRGSRPVGYVGIVTSVHSSVYRSADNIYFLDDGNGAYEDELELINNNKTNMNIKEKFALAMTPEPNKSFRKAGITNGDDLLTDDGQKVFLSWLLKQNAEVFKKEVVDDLLKDEDKK